MQEKCNFSIFWSYFVKDQIHSVQNCQKAAAKNRDYVRIEDWLKCTPLVCPKLPWRATPTSYLLTIALMPPSHPVVAPTAHQKDTDYQQARGSQVGGTMSTGGNAPPLEAWWPLGWQHSGQLLVLWLLEGGRTVAGSTTVSVGPVTIWGRLDTTATGSKLGTGQMERWTTSDRDNQPWNN